MEVLLPCPHCDRGARNLIPHPDTHEAPQTIRQSAYGTTDEWAYWVNPPVPNQTTATVVVCSRVPLSEIASVNVPLALVTTVIVPAPALVKFTE